MKTYFRSLHVNSIFSVSPKQLVNIPVVISSGIANLTVAFYPTTFRLHCTKICLNRNQVSFLC